MYSTSVLLLTQNVYQMAEIVLPNAQYTYLMLEALNSLPFQARFNSDVAASFILQFYFKSTTRECVIYKIMPDLLTQIKVLKIKLLHCVNLSLPKLHLIYLPNRHTYTIRLPYSPISTIPFKCSRNGHIEKT